MKKKKIKILEIIILITILLTILTIIILSKKIISPNPTKSDSNLIENYSITKYTKYINNINNISTYNLPLSNYINYETSTYETYITSTDNIINYLTEKININYEEIPSEEKNKIINFCNEYDEIENKYQMQCQYTNQKLIIKNNFNISQIYNTQLKTKKYNINLPVIKNSNLNDYLNELKEKNIQYYEVQFIP